MRFILHSKRNTSGHRGVSYAKQDNKWRAYICRDGKVVSLGRYGSFEEAVEARLKYEKENFVFFGKRKCSVEWCESLAISKGLCTRHYGQMKDKGEISPIKYNPWESSNDFIFNDNHVEIIIRNRKGEVVGVSLVDNEDFELIKNYKWCMSHGYACTRVGNEVVNITTILMGKRSGQVIDHIDRNKLNNKRANLRYCSSAENSRNCNTSKNNSSGITGVTFCKKTQSWRAMIKYNRKTINLGRFKMIEDAKKARLDAEKIYFKEFSPGCAHESLQLVN